MSDKIRIICDDCKRSVLVEKMEYEPVEAVKMEGTVCTECDKGGFDMPIYYDKYNKFIDLVEKNNG